MLGYTIDEIIITETDAEIQATSTAEQQMESIGEVLYGNGHNYYEAPDNRRLPAKYWE